MSMPRIKVLEVDHHRNGISGEPFWAVLFMSAGEQMLATVFDTPGFVSVLSVPGVCAGTVAFGVNSFRGDYFEPALRNAIKEWELERFGAYHVAPEA